MATEAQGSGSAAQQTLEGGSLIEEILAETKMTPGDEGYEIAKRGVQAFIAIAVRRNFPIHDAVSVEFRAEAFNILNHPMFGDVGTQSDGRNLLSNPLFGISAHSLADSLGSGGADGGLSSLYQIGSPRSMQFALKVKF